LVRVNNYWGFGVVREAWRRSDTHTEIGKHGGCGLFLYNYCSRRRQKEGAEGRETNNGKGGSEVAGRSGQGREDKTTPSHPAQPNPRPKTRPKLYAEREKGSLPYRASVVLVLAVQFLFFSSILPHRDRDAFTASPVGRKCEYEGAIIAISCLRHALPPAHPLPSSFFYSIPSFLR
jgi:hypothetical protein